MAVVFHIPAALLAHSGGRARVEVAGEPADVGEALALLWRAHPGLRDRVLTERGEVRPHVQVFVGAESIRWTGGLATPVMVGAGTAAVAEISIVPAVSGG